MATETKADAVSKELSDAFNEALDTPKDTVKVAAEPTTAPKAQTLVDTGEVDVEIVGAKPGAPYQSAKSFEDLNLPADILKGVYAKGFTKPSKIQEVAMPLIVSGVNLIAQSQNGTGKTAAFALGMLSRIDRSLKSPQAICVCPTRELARQIRDVCVDIAKFTDISFGLLVPSESKGAGSKRLSDMVLIGTPGTVVEAVQKRYIDTSNVKIFVLDEADHMVDAQGFSTQTGAIKRSLNPKCQILLFSATYEERVAAFADKFVPNATKLMLKVTDLALNSIRQYFFKCRDEKDKFKVLSDVYGVLTLGQSVIFVNTRSTADWLTNAMTKEGHSVSCLHGGDMTVSERDRVIDDFREGKTKVLIATNLIARGIDVVQVSMVVNYDIPFDQDGRPDPATYLHRIGRTGRWDRLGVAINFVHDGKSEQGLQKISAHFNKPVTLVPHDDVEALVKLIKEGK